MKIYIKNLIFTYIIECKYNMNYKILQYIIKCFIAAENGTVRLKAEDGGFVAESGDVCFVAESGRLSFVAESEDVCFVAESEDAYRQRFSGNLLRQSTSCF
ncbi:MAG: hypothetical protein IPM26_14800 [Saprospiraceae bacterium]|nr:hypothetical protein [Saprospiraceae bacterium]